MKLHLVFTLNVTGSFVNDIFCVVRSIRYHQYGISLGKDVLEIISHLINMNDMIFLRFLAEKKLIIFCIIKHSATNTTFLAQIYFPEGTQPNSRGWGTITSSPYSVNSRWGGGSKVKVPSVGYGYFFWNCTIVHVFSILLTALVYVVSWVMASCKVPTDIHAYVVVIFLSQVIFIFQFH